MKINKFFALLFILTSASGIASSVYSMKDLEVLEKENNFEEFFNHAKDIRPSERGDYWKKMVLSMAESYTQIVLKENPQIKYDTFKKIEKLNNWPNIRKSELFIRNRNSIGVKYFKHCLEESDQALCLARLDQFWSRSQSSPELGLQIGELINRKGLRYKTPLWRFYEQALKTPLAEFYCKRKHVQEAIRDQFVGLITKAPHKDRSQYLKAQMESLLHNDCWQQIIPSLKSDLKSDNRVSRDFAFTILKSKMALTTAEKDLYLTLYLLSAPSIGPRFNMAWKNLEQLSRHYKRRNLVLKSLKMIDPLPDDIFSSLLPKKSLTIIRHFAEYFPEYIEYYQDLCLRYRSGVSHFPNGNPTLNCSDFFEIAKNETIGKRRIITLSKLQQFRKNDIKKAP